MQSRDFCFWLQGFIELNNNTGAKETWHPNAYQWSKIQQHLALVFKHEIDPSMGNQQQQDELNNIHTDGDKFDSNALLRC